VSAHVWIEHPNLPGQDVKIPRAALAQHMAQGWREREDQSDPVDPDVAAALADAATGADDSADVAPVDVDHETPADLVAPVSNDDDTEES
jgi:hypothetical protein